MRKLFKLLLITIVFFNQIALVTAGTTNATYCIKALELSPAPKIDGKLDDAFWNSAVVLDSFTQYQPKEGAEPSEKTVAYVGYDSKNLYIGVRCFDSSPNAIRASLTKRDSVYGDDEITIYLDTFNDKKRAFAFQVNPYGVQTDGIYNETRRRHRGGGFNRIDKNWDTFFLTDANIDNKGYSVELAIPFKSLRFPNADSQVWGLQIKRDIPRKNEEIYWHPRSRDVNGFLAQIGELHIEGSLDKGNNLEVMPVLTGMQEEGEKFSPEPSLNLKYGITSNLTADLTFNPDFSQIEADMPKIDVNQRYALYFAEKRPFFLEGKDFFDTPIELVYTRTIDNPMWGGKVTGKIGKTTIGYLSAYDKAPGDINIPLAPDTPEQANERGLVNIFRLKQDIFQESYIGFIFSDKETGGSWNSINQNYTRVAGIDGHFKFKKYYRFAFQVVGSSSKVEDQKTDIVPAMNFSLSHASRHWNISAEYNHMPEDFEASIGYIRRKDIRQIRTRLGYNILPQNDLIVSIQPSIEYRRAYDFNNILTDDEIRIGGIITGWRGSFFWGGYTTELERYEGIDFTRQGIRLSINSQPLAWLSGNISYSAGDSIYYSDDPYLGFKSSIGVRTTLKPFSNLRIYYSLNNDTFSKSKGGERVYRINIFSQRISYQLTRTISLRLITDYNDYYKDLYNSLLLSCEYRPGTVFYLGMDDSREQDDAGIFARTGRYYFIKFSYWWRI